MSLTSLPQHARARAATGPTTRDATVCHPAGAIPPPGPDPAEVVLVTEGTYPFAPGGVSVWCDQLVNGLPEWTFRVVALTGFGYQRPVYDLPAHAADLTTVGLWDTHRHRRGWRDRWRWRSRRRSRQPAAELASTLAALLAAPDDDVAGFRRFLDRVASLGADEIDRQLGFGELLATLDAELRSPRWAPTAGVRAADLVQVAEILDHMLRPLAVEVGPAPIYHATSNGLSALVCMVAARRHGGRFLLSEHGIYLRERYIELRRSAMARPAKALLLRFHRLVSGAAYEEATVIAPCNQWNQRWEARHGATTRQLRTIYNGIDPSRFPARGDEPPEPVVAWLGRIDPIKDLETLIRAFAVVLAKRPDARLRLYGPTPPGNEDYRASLDRLVAELRLGGAVTFEGGVDWPTEAYGEAQIAVLSSISEGFPYALIEAMACGVPVVATAVGGNHEAMGDTGIVVTPRAPDLLGAALVELLDDGPRRRRLGVRARERVLQQFTLATCLDRYRSLYCELCSTPTACGAHTAHCRRPCGSGPTAGGENGNGSSGARAELDPADVEALLAAVGGPAAVDAAVDVDEVAAAFESVGLTDQVAAERFGSPDVFHLAERARDEAGARRDPGTPRHGPRDRPVVPLPSARGALGRGISYALPALVLAAASVSGVSHGAVIAASALGWGLAQGGGVLAFTVLHRTGSPRDLAPLRRALTATVAAVLAAGAGVGAVTSAAVGLTFALPLLHLVGSAALVTAERVRPALAAMAPVSLLSVAALVRPQSPAVTLVAPASVGTVAAILIVVALAARGPRPRARTLEPVDWIRSLPLVCCGWLAAAFALLAVRAIGDVGGLGGLGGVDSRQWLVLGLPLWLMVVTGEWLHIRMRRSLRALLEASPSVSVFRRAARWSVVRWLEVAVLGLQGAVWAATALSTLPPDAAWRAASIFFLVAATLVGVTVLTVASRVGVATGVLGLAVGALAGVTATRANPYAVTDHSAAIAVCAVAALVLAVAAVRALADPASHR